MDRLRTMWCFRKLCSGKPHPTIPPELASVQEPLGNAVDAALVEDLTGHTVLITGCGPTGLFAAAVARTAGAATIIATDVSDYRLGLGEQVGVDHIAQRTDRRAGRPLPQPFWILPEEKVSMRRWKCPAIPPRCIMPFVPSKTAGA